VNEHGQLATPRYCEAPGCERESKSETKGGKVYWHRYCHTHQKWAREGKDMTMDIREHGLPGMERLCLAALEYADADADDDEVFRRARIRLYTAARRCFVKSK
jgi:hypothetical protein